jgi:tRNA-specific 2-thiouridylase
MKILAALSGGVDSAVVAALLQKQGHEVIGVHLQFWSEDFCPTDSQTLPENKCCSVEALEAARAVAAKLNIPFYVLNFRDTFKEKVVDYFLETYASGATPNPCVICNREIKFGLLLTKMRELGAEAVATGHFARIQECHSEPAATGEESRQSSEILRRSAPQNDKIIYQLQTGVDPEKDQSYFLYHLGQEKLRHILFPVGDLTKSAVFTLAKEFGLKTTSDKKESQGACFFPEREPQDFLTRHLPKEALRPGPIKTLDGKTVGQHHGLPLYTIGQRRGVELGGMAEPHYVVGFDRAANTLIVGPDGQTTSPKMRVKNLSWVANTPPAEKFQSAVKIRYRGPSESATITVKNDYAEVEFDQPVRAVTPGQAAVFYAGEIVLGGGTIGE